MSEISPATRQQLTDYQRLQQSLANLVDTKTRIQIELEQVKQALNYLGDDPSGKEVYKRIGTLLVKVDPLNLKEELLQRKESLEVYIQRLDGQIKDVQKKLKKIEENLRETLQTSGAG
ncbi:MAG: prefoldin subunit [Candidatus Asgardarchaeum sp.]|nr:prefoldin subunit [Candidatus Odinarchaeota archaeon]